MAQTVNRLYFSRIGIAWLFCLLPLVSLSSETHLLDELQAALTAKKLISGHFLQCTKQEAVIVSAGGRYTLAPDDQLELIFETPQSYSLTYYRDGSYVRKDSFGESKPRYSSIGHLIFSMISLDKSVLERRFNVDAIGTREDFVIALVPKKRIKKFLQKVLITGADELIRSIEITRSNSRKIKILFGSFGSLNMPGCG